MFPGPSPAILGLEGSLTVISDDDIVLARVPDVRGTVGSRMTRTVDIPKAQASPAVISRHVSRIDGVDRIYSHRRLTGVPATLIVGVGYDAAFADWDSLRLTVIGARSVASGLILLAGFFWYTRRSRARISANALAAILTSVEHGIRVETSDHRIIAANEAGATLPRPGSANERTEMRRKDGAIIQITRHDLADGGSVLVGADVTERHAAEARIDFLTNHDRLTGLPNRWRATACIQDVLARPSGSPRLAALMLLDLDGFQDINDTIGHEGGDEVLTEIAGRLRDLVGGHDYVGVRLGRDDIVPRLGRDDIAPRLGGDVMAPIRGDVMVPIRGDVVARLGGDEFLLFLEDPDDEAAVMCLTRQISRILARPIAVRGQQVRLGASMGIAFHPGDGADVTTLFRHADIALSSAKLAGRGTARSFDATMMASFEEHRMMESDLRRALDGDELELRLQPQFSCETLEVTGFEALARWRHPTRGDVSPTIFIPIAERSGLINPLGLWAIEQACKAAAGWRSRHRVAVNLSPLQLRGETIQEDIRGILRRTQFPAHLLELEVTESVLLDEDQRTLEALHKLRAMDIRVTLDDFGTGYSSLGYLRRFPFDKIKIDKSFIQGQGTDRGTRVILEAMIRMCTDLGFDVVAEGVETEHQLNELRLLGCREIQGFLLGEPLRPEMVEEFLADHERGLVSGRHRSPTCVDS